MFLDEESPAKRARKTTREEEEEQVHEVDYDDDDEGGAEEKEGEMSVVDQWQQPSASDNAEGSPTRSSLPPSTKRLFFRLRRNSLFYSYSSRTFLQSSVRYVGQCSNLLTKPHYFASNQKNMY